LRAGGQALPQISTVVRPEWVDYNGHMSDFRYGQLFGDAMDALYREVGVDAAYRASGSMFYTVESHTTHAAEAKVGEALTVSTQILAVDDKRLRVFHTVRRRADGTLIATGEQMHLHVDVKAAKAAPTHVGVRAKLERIARAHAELPLPAAAGRRVGQPKD
jgi:carnitine 3-dehydrogenase